jgi:hypothetical protein
MSGIVGRPYANTMDLHHGSEPGASHPDAGPLHPRAKMLLRLSVMLRRRGLDRQLAAGIDPASSADLNLRAWQLVQPSSRRRVAKGLRRAVGNSQSRRLNQMSSVVPISRQAANEWSQGLLGVADAIERSDRVSAYGVALALELLTDGTGPLYDPGAEHLLGSAIWSIAEGLHT